MPKRRPSHQGHLQLPLWKVVPSDWAGWVVITCPRCKNEAIVHRQRWLNARRNRDYVARSCTYCFKVARVPNKEG